MMASPEPRPEPPGSIGRGPHVISIQSQVAHGHVGNSAAVFPMQALGVDVAAVPTTLLSNHPIYPTMRGRVLDAALVADLLQGLEERGLVEATAAILTGYLGSAEIRRRDRRFPRSRKGAQFRLCSMSAIRSSAMKAQASSSRRAWSTVFAIGLSRRPRSRRRIQFELELLAGVAARSVEASAPPSRASARGGYVVTGCALADTAEARSKRLSDDAGPCDRHRDATAADQSPMARAISSPDCWSRISSSATILSGAARQRPPPSSTVLQRTFAEDPMNCGLSRPTSFRDARRRRCAGQRLPRGLGACRLRSRESHPKSKAH